MLLPMTPCSVSRLAFTLLTMSLPLNEALAAGATVGGSYQDKGGKLCAPAATTCQLTLSARPDFDTRLASISCSLLVAYGTGTTSIIKEWYLGQTGNVGGLVYLSPLAMGSNDATAGQASFQVYVSQPNYGLAKGNKPFIKVTFTKAVEANLNCSIVGLN